MPLGPGEIAERLGRLGDRPARWILFGAILLGAAFLMRPSLNSDGDFYYGWVRSLLFDGDINMYNEAVHYPHGWMYAITGTVNDAGYPYNGFSCGPGLLWLPFIGAAHLVALLPFSRAPADGYSAPYIAALGAAGLLAGLAGVWLLYALCRRFASPPASLAAALGLFGASPWLGYVYGDASFSHAYSVLGVLIFLHAMLAARDRRTFLYWCLAGAALGGAMLMRWQNALFGAVAAAFLLERAMVLQARPETERPWRLFADAAGFALTALLIFSPQLLIWYVGSGEVKPPVSGGFLQWQRAITAMNVLFDPLHGFFTWSPFLLIAFFLIPIFWRRDRYLCGALFLVFYLQVYLNGVVTDWWAGGSFGMRRLCNCLPLFAFPVACALEMSRDRKWIRWLLLPVLAIAVWWNGALATAWFGAAIDTLQALDRDALKQTWAIATSPWGAHVVLVRLPIYRGLFSALPYGDFAGFLRTTAFLAVPGLLGAGMIHAVNRLTRPHAPDGARRLRVFHPAAFIAAGIGVSLAANLWIAVTAAQTGRILLPGRGPGGEGLDSVSATFHTDRPFRGGNLDLALAPGDVVSVTVSQSHIEPFQRLAVVSRVEGGGSVLEPLQPALRIAIADASGAGIARELRIGAETAPSDLAPFSRRLQDAPLLMPTRTWRVSPKGWAVRREYGAVLELGEPLPAARITLTSLLPVGVVRVTGLGLAVSVWESFVAPDSAAPADTAALARLLADDPWADQVVIDLGDAANSDYRSNPFIPRSVGERAEFPALPPGVLDYRDLRFHIRRPYAETGEWSVITTACGDGYVAVIPAGNRRYRSLAFAWCGGAIRRARPAHLADLTLIYEDGTTQRRALYSNRDVYELLHHTPLDSVIWDAHGRLSYWSIETAHPDKPLQAIRLEDVNGPANDGLALFAITGRLAELPPEMP